MLPGLGDSLELLSGYTGGFVTTTLVAVEIAVVSIVLSWLCGIIAALAADSGNRVLRGLSDFYVWFIRGTPTLIQIFIVYFGLPQMGFKLSPFIAGVIALGINSGAFVAEIIRSGLLAVPAGQRDASRSLGMAWWQEMWLVVMPQVIRITLPSLTNEAITLLKNTSLLSTITVVELTLYSQMAIARTFRPFEFYITAALIYLALTTLLSMAARVLERRYALER